MDIDCCVAFSFQCRICLYGDKNIIPDAIALHNHVCRGEFDYFAFDIVYHDVQNIVTCKIMIKSCKRNSKIAKFAGLLRVYARM